MNIRESCPDKMYFKRRIIIEDEKKIPCFSILKFLWLCQVILINWWTFTSHVLIIDTSYCI